MNIYLSNSRKAKTGKEMIKARNEGFSTVAFIPANNFRSGLSENWLTVVFRERL